MRVEELIVQHGVRGIVVHSEFTLAAVALAAGAARGIPVLHTVHTFFWRSSRLLGPLAPGVRWFHRRLTHLPSTPRSTGSTAINNALRGMTLRVAVRADVVLSPSEHQAEALRRAGARSARAFSNVSEPLEPSAPPPDEPLTLVWAARFAPEKRLDVALDAVRIAGETLGPGRVLLHVAGGAHRPQADVVFHGRVPGDEVARLVAGAHAVLITSLGFDNQPMIALEAFTRGRPVVVTDPVLRDEFGAAALGTDTPDAAGLAAVLVRAVRDRDLLRAAGQAALTYAQERQPDRHAAALADDRRGGADGVRTRRQPANRVPCHPGGVHSIRLRSPMGLHNSL
ncbi:glycosyltransferase family 4 protein [Microbacterium elymi]|uniref:D-inositol 3-phosphate glycosyltransferase n=1 Tax=Microbacterium elymi TaxID=2909587 RepID=A0ABY5NI15_9MICO|nr:glycosyltransferase family 4 protein [Microbacterium elymi]UUT34802.1 glycosyltransferase family 4 protein [Microbacterium elymi]